MYGCVSGRSFVFGNDNDFGTLTKRYARGLCNADWRWMRVFIDISFSLPKVTDTSGQLTIAITYERWHTKRGINFRHKTKSWKRKAWTWQVDHEHDERVKNALLFPILRRMAHSVYALFFPESCLQRAWVTYTHTYIRVCINMYIPWPSEHISITAYAYLRE